MTQIFYVSTTGVNANNGLSQLTPVLTISHAISLASNGDTINVAAGTYTDNVTINKSVTIEGANKTTTIIEPPNTTTTATVQITDGATTTTIKKLTIKGKFATQTTTGSGDSANNFSAILVLNTDTTNYPVIDNLLFDDLVLTQASNGLAFNNKHSNNITVKNSIIENNEGAGIRIATATETMNGFTVEGCTIQNNNLGAISSNPSGSYRPDCTNFHIKECTIQNNNLLTTNHSHDVTIFSFNGDIQVLNTTITSNHEVSKGKNGSSATAGGWGFYISGYRLSTSPNTQYNSGNIILNNVTFNGTVIRSGLGIERYLNLNLTMIGVDLRDYTPNLANLTWRQVTIAHTNLTSLVDLGNTKLRSLSVGGVGSLDARACEFYRLDLSLINFRNDDTALQTVYSLIDDVRDNNLLGEVLLLYLYVTATGNDTTGNGTSKSPFATVQKALGIALFGDIIQDGNNIYKSMNNTNYTGGPILVTANANSIITTSSGSLNITIESFDFTATSGTAYLIKSGFNGGVLIVDIKALTGVSEPITNFASTPLAINLILPQANTGSTLKMYKLTSTGNLMSPQPSGYPVTLTYNGTTTSWSALLPSLSSYLIQDTSSQLGDSGGDPMIKTIYGKEMLLPNDWLYVKLYQKDDIKVNAKCGFIDSDVIKKLHFIRRGGSTIYNLDPEKHKWVLNFTYFVEIDIFKNNELVFKHDLLNDKELINKNITVEKNKSSTGMYSLTHKRLWPAINLSSFFVHLNNNNILNIDIDNYWDDINYISIKLFDTNFEGYLGEFFNHSIENKLL